MMKNLLKKPKLPPEEKAFRLKMALGFLAIVLAVAYFPFDRLSPNKVTVVSDTIPSMHVPVQDEASVSVIHETKMAEVMLEEMKTLAPNELTANINEQEQIDAILKAFHRLPGQELDRLQIDLNQPVTANTPEAEALFTAWKLRQAELKEAMKNILKPAEFMTNITRTLNGTTSQQVQAIVLTTAGVDASEDNTNIDADTAKPVELSVEDKVYLLGQLESLLDDVDNARDFHTIGAWPTLVSFLRPDHPLQVRSAAAWAVGSAVKNTYDYQLWTLESLARTEGSESNESGAVAPVTCLELLVEALAPAPISTENSNIEARYELQKRALYALSAAMRGNMDVQDALLRMPIPSADGATIEVRYVHHLHALTQNAQLPAELLRKVWAAAADLLEERAYIRRELAHEVKLIQAALSGAQANATGSDAAAVQKQVDTARALQEAVLLGDHLINSEWLQAASVIAEHYTTALSEVEAQIRLLAAGSPDATEPAMRNSEQVAMHATLRSVFSFVREVLVDSPELHATVPNTITTTDISTGTPATTDAWQRQLQVAVLHVQDICAHDTEGAYETLKTHAEELSALLGLLDQGANSAVF